MSEFDQAMAIDAVHKAANAERDATTQLRAAVLRAYRLGVNQTELAAATRVSRQTIWRWVAVAGDPDQRKPTVAIRDALRQLMPYLEPHQMDQISRRLGSDVNQLLLALRMLRSWLPSSALREMTEDERMVLGLATQAEAAILAAQARGQDPGAGGDDDQYGTKS